MILSVSKKTDIPAFYSEWFMNRIREGFLLKFNKNDNKYEKINLSQKNVECIVFWSKDPRPMLDKLPELKSLGYQFYFQITITPYGDDIEKNISNKKEILNAFKYISKTYGKKAVVWRYDPIILTDKYSIDFHKKAFRQLAKSISPYCDECVISFVDNIEKGTQLTYYETPDDEEIEILAKSFSDTGKEFGMNIKTCYEKCDLSEFGIEHAACVDKDKIEALTGLKLKPASELKIPEKCECYPSFDIGEYYSCMNRCEYCYAGGTNNFLCKSNYSAHDCSSPLLLGKQDVNKTVKTKKFPSIVSLEQISLFKQNA